TPRMAPKVFWRAESHAESLTESRKSYRKSKVLPKIESLTESRNPYRKSKVLPKVESPTESRNPYR
ncbi:13921_t:CDS:1, partial [Cetraspora pellucida]